eukprot:scaffold61771_cov67-Phaeocystis_antarctica.AAC.1
MRLLCASTPAAASPATPRARGCKPMLSTLQPLCPPQVSVPPFYVAFILAPLASHASECIASYSYAAKKTKKTITVSLAALEAPTRTPTPNPSPRRGVHEQYVLPRHRHGPRLLQGARVALLRGDHRGAPRRARRRHPRPPPDHAAVGRLPPARPLPRLRPLHRRARGQRDRLGAATKPPASAVCEVAFIYPRDYPRNVPFLSPLHPQVRRSGAVPDRP